MFKIKLFLSRSSSINKLTLLTLYSDRWSCSFKYSLKLQTFSSKTWPSIFLLENGKIYISFDTRRHALNFSYQMFKMKLLSTNKVRMLTDGVARFNTTKNYKRFQRTVWYFLADNERDQLWFFRCLLFFKYNFNIIIYWLTTVKLKLLLHYLLLLINIMLISI